MHSHSEITELLASVDLLIVRNLGKHMKNDLNKSKVKYTLVSGIKIEDELINYQKKVLK